MKLTWEKLLSSERERKSRGYNANVDLRSAFEKDYQRIIISASFRRLQDKTQVFTFGRYDFVRTRLTHSLEVSSFAKSLGQKISASLIARNIEGAPTIEESIKIADILLCSGLIHDIGNPPFGHYGETTIRDFFARNLDKFTLDGKSIRQHLNEDEIQDFLHYEGNAQALRLLSKLHYLVDEHGMNLTYAVLASIIKYPVSSLDVDKKSGNITQKKMGYFAAEKDLFVRIAEACGIVMKVEDREDPKNIGQIELIPSSKKYVVCRHPLTFILEAADDIAYNTADTEDAYRKGIISYELISSRFLEAKNTDLYRNLSENDRFKFDKICERMTLGKREALYSNYAESELTKLQNTMIFCQTLLLDDITESFVENYTKIMDGEFERSLSSGRLSGLIIGVLSTIATEYVFPSKLIVHRDITADAVLSFLLDALAPSVIRYDSDEKMSERDHRMISLISENYKLCYREHAKGKSKSEKLYLRLMLLCDFICGMTDSYARQVFELLSGKEID